MLQVARLAPSLLAEAAPLVVSFLGEQLAEDGGARDRDGASDLYYTAFLLDGLIALRAELPDAGAARVRGYLASFGDGAELDLVHRACLVRCHAALGGAWPGPTFRDRALSDLETLRSADGGYARRPGLEQGTLYDAFLAVGMQQDLGAPPVDPDALVESFDPLRTPDGAFANAAGLPLGTTPSTAAAAALLAQLGAPPPPEVGPWLLAQRHPKGGFRAMPEAPLPDLLSTATALHALSALGVELDAATREASLDFVDSLWSGRGFYGHWADDDLDCEYAFYALLALGHLSVAP